ncbi:MAG: diguanylate cyclase domain-containing protein [Acidimicrobiales bacterium]
MPAYSAGKKEPSAAPLIGSITRWRPLERLREADTHWLPPGHDAVRQRVAIGYLVWIDLVVWSVLPGHWPFSPLAFYGPVGVGFSFAIVSDVVSRRSKRGSQTYLRWLVVWSLLEVLLVSLVMAATGHGHAQLIWIYLLVVIFSAAFFPVAAQVAVIAAVLGLYTFLVALPVRFNLAGTVLRLVGLVTVAHLAGFLAARLRQHAHDAAVARRDADARARALAVVAGSAERLAEDDGSALVPLTLHALGELGYDQAALVVFDGEHRKVGTSATGAGLEPCLPRSAAELPGSIDLRREPGSGTALVSVPVRLEASVAGAMVVRSASPELDTSLREALELLSRQVGSSLTVARRLRERMEMEEMLVHQATHDSLTGLPNRALLEMRVSQALVSARREGTGTAVLFIDLDEFKAVNDSLGHEGGDRLLVAAVDRLAGCTRERDLLARYGGDEFVLLAEGLASEVEAPVLADRLLGSLAEPIRIGSASVSLCASVGVAYADPFGRFDGERHFDGCVVGASGRQADEQGAEQGAARMLRRADLAMYTAKSRGKARYEMAG